MRVLLYCVEDTSETASAEIQPAIVYTVDTVPKITWCGNSNNRLDQRAPFMYASVSSDVLIISDYGPEIA